MTENDTSPENLRKFLESEDPAMVRMGLSMAKGVDFTDDLLEEILWMYMFHDEKTIRAAAKSIFMKMAPKKLKEIIKNNWKAKYRTFSRPGEKFTQVIRPLVQSITQDKLDIILPRLMKPVIEEVKRIQPYNNITAERKNDAVKALGDFGDIAVEPLIEILEEKGTLLLFFEGYWIEKTTDFEGNQEREAPSSVTVEIENLHRAPNTIAAEALGKIGDKRALKPLITALITWDADLIKSAKEALRKLSGKMTEKEIEISDAIVKNIVQSTVIFDGNATSKSQDDFTLTHLLDSSYVALEPLFKFIEVQAFPFPEGVARKAAETLGNVGHKLAVEPLIKALENNVYPSVRRKAAEALGKIGDKRAVKPLIKALEDESNYACEFALVKFGNDAVELLIKALEDENNLVRENATEALGNIGDKRAVEPLIKALDDEKAWVCAKTAVSLGKIGDKRAVEPLIKALETARVIYSDDDPYGAEMAHKYTAEALGEIGDKRAVEPLIKDLGDGGEEAAEALGKIGDKRAVEPLIKSLEDENPWNRQDAVKALGKIGDKRAVEPLIKELEYENEYVRDIILITSIHVGAAKALGEIGDKRAVEPLIKSLEDDVRYKFVRKAVDALGKIGDKQAVEPLIKVLENKDLSWARENAAEALVKITKANIKGKEKKNIIKFLESDDMVMMGASILKGILEE